MENQAEPSVEQINRTIETVFANKDIQTLIQNFATSLKGDDFGNAVQNLTNTPIDAETMKSISSSLQSTD